MTYKEIDEVFDDSKPSAWEEVPGDDVDSIQESIRQSETLPDLVKNSSALYLVSYGIEIGLRVAAARAEKHPAGLLENKRLENRC